MCHSFQCWQHCLHLEHPSSLQVCNTVRQGHASQVVGLAYHSIFTFACFSKRCSLQDNPSLSLRQLCSPQYSATLAERTLSNTGSARRPLVIDVTNAICDTCRNAHRLQRVPSVAKQDRCRSRVLSIKCKSFWFFLAETSGTDGGTQSAQ